MDKNTIIGLVLIAALLIGYSWYTKPSEEEIAQQRMQDSITAVAKEKAEQQMKAEQQAGQANAARLAAQDTTVAFYKSLHGKAQNIVLRNSKVELTLNTKGGTVEKAVFFEIHAGRERDQHHNERPVLHTVKHNRLYRNDDGQCRQR